MSAFLITDRERDTLRGLSHLQRCIYLLGLRPFMDATTGLVGTHKRRISYQSLAEEMYVDPIPGVRGSGSPSKMQLRRAISALAKAGLITIESTQTQLIICCVLALNPACAQNKADSNSSSKPPSYQTTKTPKIVDKNLQNLTSTEQGATLKAAIPQLINKYKKIITPACDLKTFTPIVEDYQPSGEVFNAVKAGQGLEPSSTQLLLFIQHCKSKGKVSANWDAEFIKWLIIGKQLNERWSQQVSKPAHRAIKHCGRALDTPRLAVNALPLPPVKARALPDKPIVLDAQYQKHYAHFSKLSKAECLAYLKRYQPRKANEKLNGIHAKSLTQSLLKNLLTETRNEAPLKNL